MSIVFELQRPQVSLSCALASQRTLIFCVNCFFLTTQLLQLRLYDRRYAILPFSLLRTHNFK